MSQSSYHWVTLDDKHKVASHMHECPGMPTGVRFVLTKKKNEYQKIAFSGIQCSDIKLVDCNPCLEY